VAPGIVPRASGRDDDSRSREKGRAAATGDADCGDLPHPARGAGRSRRPRRSARRSPGGGPGARRGGRRSVRAVSYSSTFIALARAGPRHRLPSAARRVYPRTSGQSSATPSCGSSPRGPPGDPGLTRKPPGCGSGMRSRRGPRGLGRRDAAQVVHGALLKLLGPEGAPPFPKDWTEVSRKALVEQWKARSEKPR